MWCMWSMLRGGGSGSSGCDAGGSQFSSCGGQCGGCGGRCGGYVLLLVWLLRCPR